MNDRSASAQTALGPMVIAAAERYTPRRQRLLDDELAVRFLPPAGRWIVRACRWQPVRDLLVRVTERSAPGLWGSMLCRKRYADDAAADALAAGIEQVVILGAGLDTKACRLVAPAGALAFELDQRANTDDKLRRLREIYGQVPERVRVIPVDFEGDDLAAVLAASGFDSGRPALFVWEAVTQYLTEESVRATFAYLAKAPAGSRLIFTYVRADFLDGTNSYGAGRLRQRMTGLWKWGIAPPDVAALLREYGWVEREQVGPAEYAARYLRPAGRDMPVSEIERFVGAEKV
ncbi:SAM-dependent methyltransferase [Pseudonocardia adelaidensis]|uniref:S-adenosyl-L-methionine-dependent methyltransferase n=1 Tax=Pseudonocardia adelaidensis TaxID=648754 RepID=A0ABP9NFU8_9PSEU